MSGNRPLIMGKAMALNGDKTTTGATCLATIENVTCFGKKALRVGDPTTNCPKCGKAGTVVTGESGFNNHGKLQAVHDSIVQCGCPSGSNRVIAYSAPANQRSVVQNSTPPVSMYHQSSRISQSTLIGTNNAVIIEECKTSDNLLYEGVFVWTETFGSGHSFVTIHENNQVSLYSYGRYGTPGPLTLTGDGIMLYMTSDDAREYMRTELYELNARVFKITDANIHKTKNYFNNLWSSGSIPQLPEKSGELTRRNGRSIDVYDVTGNNCTTHTVKGLKHSGTQIFNESYTPIRTQYPIDREESFTVPISLQSFLDGKKHNFQKLDVLEVTGEFKTQYPNYENLTELDNGIKNQIFELATFTAKLAGKATSIDGGETGGVLGSSYDQ